VRTAILRRSELGLSMTLDPPARVRAGFLRRLSAVLIDFFVISVPFQLIVAILFMATSGRIQQFGGVTYASCAVLQNIPDGIVLAPPPPAGSNFARECSVYFFGAQTGRSLQVGRVTRHGASIQTISRSYMLDRDGQPVDGMTVDWVVMAVFIVYLFAFETRTGASLGDRATRIVVVDALHPADASIPLRKIIVRYLVMLIGLVPMFVVTLIFLGPFGPDIDALGDSAYFTWLWATGAFAIAWGLYLSIVIIRKRDPLYDKIAGTAVVRV